MEKEFKINLEETTLRIDMGAELSKANAPALQEQLSGYKGRDIRKIVFDATDLVFISSAGIRCIIYARRELGQKPDIVFENCANEIYGVFEMTGLSRFINFVEDNRTKNLNGKAEAANNLSQKLAKNRQDELDDFATNNDVVCYQMKLGEEE